MNDLIDLTILFTALFSLAILVERFLEILKSVYDLVDSRMDFHRYWTRRARALKKRLEQRLLIHQYTNHDEIARVVASFSDLLLGKRDGYAGRVPVLSGDLIRALYVKIGTILIGCGIGIALTCAFELDIIGLMIQYMPRVPLPESFNQNILPVTVRRIATGIIIGLGTGPVHKIITSIERGREESRNEGMRKGAVKC